MRRYTKGDYFENNRGKYVLLDRRKGWNSNIYKLKVLEHENPSKIGQIVHPSNLMNYTRID